METRRSKLHICLTQDQKLLSKAFYHFECEFENKLPVCGDVKSHELTADVYLIEFRAVRIVRKHTAVNNTVMEIINISIAYKFTTLLAEPLP